MVLSHGLQAYSANAAKNAQKLKKSMSSAQRCCSLKGEEIGPVGVWLKGAILALGRWDLHSFRPEEEYNDFSRFAYFDWESNNPVYEKLFPHWYEFAPSKMLLTRYEEVKQYIGDGNYREAIVCPLRVVGVWVKQNATRYERAAAAKIACLFKKPLSVI